MRWRGSTRDRMTDDVTARPALPLTGGCQCGAVRYRILSFPLTLYCCHCRECQRQSSSAFGMSMQVESSAIDVAWQEMGCHIRSEGETRAVEGWFCKKCGVRLFHRRPGRADVANVKAGSLDDTSWLRPIGHIWMASAQNWVTVPSRLLKCQGQPEDFEPFVKAWRRQHRV